MEDINKVSQIKDEVLEKVKEVLENGTDEVIHFRYHGKKVELEAVEEVQQAVFQPKVQTTRLTLNYLPDKSKQSNFSSPPESEINFNKHIIGIGDYGNLQFYFIFNDNS